MTNLNLQFHRDTQGRKWLSSVLGSSKVLEIPDEFTPVTLTEQAEERKNVRRAVEGLGEPDREIFLRHYYYAQTVTEIGQSMDLNVSTVKTKLRRGRQRLKEMLTRWECL